ncbi:MAG: uroporphyrinogen-III C-methyltransferase [Actinobacteria bacterium HGW-Actinobacteria-4]|nr:MAG: uroporphyrinogen-III C-methyltransferase [Actinobacteria bacterium HGW-Actinobacteria-4]
MTALFGLDFRGKPVVVVGGGTVATRRVRRMVDYGAQVTVVAPEVSDDLSRMASHGDITVVRREVQPGDLTGVWFVVAATNESAVNAKVADWAHDQRIWCTNASDSHVGSARTAAVSHHSDIAVGVVSTGEPDPQRIRGVRDALADFIDSGAVSLRRQRAHGGKVILVGSGPGDDGLLTMRGRQAVAEADVVITDRLGATRVLSTLSPDVEVINVGKSPDNHPVPQHQINALIVDRATAGSTVVRFKGGDPFLFGRGGEEVHACLAAGIDVEVVPGVTSALAVPALAGIPVTQRGVSNSVLITSGHAGADTAALAAMTSGATVVILMGVAALPVIVEAALAAGAGAQLPVAIIESGSTDRERVTRGDLGSIVRIADETGVKPPAVIVVGQVASPGLLADDVSATPEP